MNQHVILPVLCMVMSFSLCEPLRGQQAVFECVWATSPITIDGKADEVAWASAVEITEFRIPPAPGAKTKTATRARLLWDRQFLYFYAELEDRDLFADVLEHDGITWNNDVFEMFFKPNESAPGYYEFQVNAAGTKMDLFIPDRKRGGYEEFKSSHTFQWESKVVLDGTLHDRTDRDQKWTVEGRFPWTDFLHTGGRPNVNEVWKIALCRYDYTLGQKPELSSCAPLTAVNFHRVDDYASLRFRGPAQNNADTKKLSERKAHRDSQVVGSPDPPLPYRAVRAYPGLNLEWPIDVKVEPGTRRFLVLEEQGSYGPSILKRTHEDPTNSELQTIADPKGVAYSIAFHPKFQENGFLYIGCNGKGAQDKNFSRILRYVLNRSAPYEAISEPTTIIEWESNGHNGVGITFGLDGMLYVTSGDGTSDSDTNIAGQDLTKLLSKVLRIDVDHPELGKMYSIPADNPFIGFQDARPETWAYGLRNPWRITTDTKTGHIWVGNNGQDMYEQAYLIERGANYGWSVYEGSHPFYLNRKLGPTPLVKPTVEHSHSESRSLTGGMVYYGSKLPELVGAYLYADHSTGKIWAVKHNGSNVVWHREVADTPFNITALTSDPDGEILIVDHRGERKGGVYFLEPNPQRDQPNSFPTKLSLTGLFESVRNHRTAEGVIPYSVNAPFWSDGAMKARFIALPSGGRIGVTDRWAWDLPESTVLGKSFSFEMIDGKPESRTWIETRLLVKQQGEWVGYSYAWNADQSDAELVSKDGRDHIFPILNTNNTKARDQAWRYPSRTECMVCHTRAANYVLGFTTHQLNREQDYGDGLVMNQLDALEIMGVLKSTWLEGQPFKRNESQAPIRSDMLLNRPADQYPALANPYDPSQPLEARARAFLHSNCAYCHVEAGGGNATMDLSIYAKRDRMNILDVVPAHHHFGIENARLVAPGAPQRSVLLHRVGIRSPGQMPQLSSSLVDRSALSMLQEWVASLKPADSQTQETK